MRHWQMKARIQRAWPWLVGAGIGWGLIVVVVSAFSDPTPENKTLAVSIWTAGLYTLVLRLLRGWWLPLVIKNPLRNAALLGILNAAVIETEFLIFQKVFGAEGVAAHPNLLVDLLVTMPWYSTMVLTFVAVQHRHRFSTASVLFLGGIYEIGGDGVAGQVGELMTGNLQLFSIEYWLMILFIYLWAFIPVYSSMVLPSAWVIGTSQLPETKPILPRGLAALLPLMWILPFGIYLVALIILLSTL